MTLYNAAVEAAVTAVAEGTSRASACGIRILGSAYLGNCSVNAYAQAAAIVDAEADARATDYGDAVVSGGHFHARATASAAPSGGVNVSAFAVAQGLTCSTLAADAAVTLVANASAQGGGNGAAVERERTLNLDASSTTETIRYYSSGVVTSTHTSSWPW